MALYRFDVGNSHDGVVGMVLEVKADDRQTALQRLRHLEDIGIVGEWIGECFVADLPTAEPGVSLSLCVNPSNLKYRNLTEVEGADKIAHDLPAREV